MNQTAPDLSGRRVFLVEDESLIVMLIEDALDDLGCEVAGVASRFDDAVVKARALAFDIAILDVNLARPAHISDRGNYQGPRHPVRFCHRLWRHQRTGRAECLSDPAEAVRGARSRTGLAHVARHDVVSGIGRAALAPLQNSHRARLNASGGLATRHIPV